MKKALAIILLIIGIIFITLASCIFNIYAAPHTLIFCIGLFVGFFLLVIAKKPDLYFWVTVGITSVLVCLTSMFLVSFVPKEFELMDLRIFFNPIITILTSLFYFISVYLANFFASKGDKWSIFNFLIIVIPLTTIFSTIGSVAKLASDAFSNVASTPIFETIYNLFMMLIVFLPQGLIFSLVLFSVFVGFAKLYGFPEKIELDLQK